MPPGVEGSCYQESLAVLDLAFPPTKKEPTNHADPHRPCCWRASCGTIRATLRVPQGTFAPC